MIAYLVVAIAAVFFLAIIGLGVRVVESTEAENDRLAREIEASRMYRESLGTRIEQVRRYRHDADSLLRAIEHASAQDAPGDAGTRSFDSAAKRAPELPDARYPLAQAALDLHKRQCAEAGIPFVCRVADDVGQVLAARGIDDSDVCIVLQNLLDNAYEANCLIEPGGDERFGRMMAISARTAQNRLQLEVRNRTATSEQPTFRSQKAQRPLHGVGMMVVDEIAKKHGGTMSVSFDSPSRVLAVRVLL